ncbi:hypothetical protein A9Q99_10405 [Gammaproteobacteria bacterium 45_16_T64]|nr:hypothetical protein A9Q99_10405 [Gammaproteobacteria bacterium 45_16_T64]
MLEFTDKLVIAAGIFGVAFSMSGCKQSEIDCVAGNKQPESCDLYTAVGTESSPMENDVIIMGDSLWDLGSPYGAIPLNLIERSKKTYLELARSGAHTNYIRDIEIPKIPNYNGQGLDPDPTVKTIIVNGGANNLKEPCKVDLENNINVDEGTYSTACTDAFTVAVTEAEEIISLLSAIDSVENIVWTGPQYFPVSVVSENLIDKTVGELSSLCSDDLTEKCTYVDLTQAPMWGPDDASIYLYDDIHVNVAGAELIGGQVWSILESIGAYR